MHCLSVSSVDLRLLLCRVFVGSDHKQRRTAQKPLNQQHEQQSAFGRLRSESNNVSSICSFIAEFGERRKCVARRFLIIDDPEIN